MWSMLLPTVVSAFGFFVSGIFAFAFSDVSVVRANVQSWAVLISSGLIVWGAELNTPGTVIEVFRKIIRKEANGWDISSLVISGVGTTVNLLVTFASRTRLSPVWQTFVLTWGPLLSGIAVAFDYYGGLVELGFLFGTYELRIDDWRKEKRAFDVENGQDVSVTPEFVSRLEAMENKIERLSWPAVTKKEWEGLTSGLNRQTPETMSEAEEFLAQHKRKLPNPRTATRWGLKA